MKSELAEHAELANWRLAVLAAGAALIILAGSVLAWVVYPTPMEQCAKSCGERFLSWSAGTPQYMEMTKGPLNPNIAHPPVPSKCECKP